MRLSMQKINAMIWIAVLLLLTAVPTVNVQAAGEKNRLAVTKENVEETAEKETEVTEEVDGKDGSEELKERNEFLSNSYKQLEEKYQREKEFSRSVIHVLIFIIAILAVALINVIIFYRKKIDKDFEDSFIVNKKASKTLQEQNAEKDSREEIWNEELPKKELPKEEFSKEEISKEEISKEALPKEEIPEEEVFKEELLKKTEIQTAPETQIETEKEKKKKVLRGERKAQKTMSGKAVKEKNDFEVLDFNDED